MENTILSMIDELKAGKSALSDEELFNITKRVLHKLGKVREDKIRLEFMDVASRIGRSECCFISTGEALDIYGRYR